MWQPILGEWERKIPHGDSCPKREVQIVVRFKDLLLASRVYFGGKLLVVNHVFPNSESNRCVLGNRISTSIAVPSGAFPWVTSVCAVSEQCTASTPRWSSRGWNLPHKTLENMLMATAPASPGVLLGALSVSLFLSLSLSLFLSFSLSLSFCVSLSTEQRSGKKPKAWGQRSQTFTYLFNLKSFPRTCPFLPLLIL